MSSEILEALQQITKDKNIEMDYVIETLETSLLLAAKKKFGNADNLKVKLDLKTGEINISATKKIVDKVNASNLEISLEEAKKVEEKAELGQEINIRIGFEEFGRNAILTAKQILIQKVREAEREKIYEEYKDRVGELVTGTIQQVEKGNVLVNLGKAEAILPPKEQIQKEKYRQGDRVRACILNVEKSAKGPSIVLSRVNPILLVRLFELEVPEIFERIIEIKAIAREPGERSKIAVSSIDDRIDPVGACVGVKGVRVQSIVRELSNERIDIVPWSAIPENFVTRALAPAKTIKLDVYPDEKSMVAVVEDDKLSLAIGKGGQNAKLASKLTGWKINILSESDYKAQKKLETGPEIVVTELQGVGEKLKEKLVSAGIDSVQDLAKTSLKELMKIEGVGEKKARSLIESAKKYLTPAQPGKTDERSKKIEQ
ncbi:MAG: transcription termination factor NusA [candidate division Zixibacteria bacterium]|nr:transcription termination factor NusA [candidate division Zixibacteria bacterium]